MSKLSFIGRQWTVFDAANKTHRRYFKEFQRNRTWGHCPVRFICDDAGADLLTMIQRRLIQYYVDREFGVDKVKVTQV